MPNKAIKRKQRHQRRAAARDESAVMLLTAPIEWREIEAAADGSPKPRTFSILAYTGGLLHLPTHRYPVVVDLTGLRAASQSLPVLRDHKGQDVVGHTDMVDINVPASNVSVAGVVSGTGSAAKEVVASSTNGFPWQASINAIASKLQFVRAGSNVQANGQTFTGPVYVAKKALLREVSITALGGDIGGTSVRIAATAGTTGDEAMDPIFVEWLAANGWEDPDALAENQLASLKAAWEASTADPDPDPDPKPIIKAAGGDGGDDPLVAYRKRFADETARVAAIQAACGTDHLTIQATAIAEGWDATKTELEVLKASRPKAPAGHVHSPDRSEAVIEAAVCQSMGVLNEEDFDDKVLEAAHREFQNEIGIKELLMISATANGYPSPTFRNGDLKEILAAAFTGHTLASNILSNTANKSILRSFNYVETVWREIATIVSNPDFKTGTRYRLLGDATYQTLSPQGKIEHGTLDAETYTTSLETFARMYALTRRDIINDDLGALDTLSARLGRGAGLKINNVFWTEFLDSGTFFTTARGNLLEGAAYALTAADPVAAMDAAFLLYLNQTDPDGEPASIEPAVLLYPNALNGSALDLLQTTGFRPRGTTDGLIPTINRYQGQLKPLKSSYLGNSSYTGYSTTAWYLLSNSLDVPVIEMSFLNGKQTPTIESADADFNELGIQLRGFHDFDANKQEYRGGVKVDGTD